MGKKKNFGKGPDKHKEKDFIASENLNPDMKTMGFIVDRHLYRVGKMLQEKVYCKIPDSSLDSEAIC